MDVMVVEENASTRYTRCVFSLNAQFHLLRRKGKQALVCIIFTDKCKVGAPSVGYRQYYPESIVAALCKPEVPK